MEDAMRRWCSKRSKKMKLYIKKHIRLSFENAAAINNFYRSLQIDYPKFFKMDGLSKLGFLAAEMIFKERANRFEPREDIAIIGFNRSSSLDTDTQYQATIGNNENYYPSPSLFVYTLPNIVTGEIAIRNKLLGETSFYICETLNVKQMAEIVENAFFDAGTKAVLAMWIEHFEGKNEVFGALVGSEKSDMEFTEEQLKLL